MPLDVCGPIGVLDPRGGGPPMVGVAAGWRGRDVGGVKHTDTGRGVKVGESLIY